VYERHFVSMQMAVRTKPRRSVSRPKIKRRQ
jgi:hypothetical protein